MSYLKHNFVLRPLLSFVCHLVSVVIFSKVSGEFGVWDFREERGRPGKGARLECCSFSMSKSQR